MRYKVTFTVEDYNDLGNDTIEGSFVVVTDDAGAALDKVRYLINNMNGKATGVIPQLPSYSED